MFTTGLSGYERRNAARRKKSVRGQRSNSLMTQKYWHLRGTIVLCVRVSVCATIKACTRAAAYEKLHASEESSPPKCTHHSGWGSIPLFFLCAFWSMTLEKGDGNAKLLLLFLRWPEVAFDFSKKEWMRKLGGGNICRKSFDIVNTELKCRLFTSTVSFLVATATTDTCPPMRRLKSFWSHPWKK